MAAEEEPLIGVIEQSTNNSRFLLINSRGEVVDKSNEVEVKPIPGLKEGWCEQNAKRLIESVEECIEEVMERNTKSRVIAVGITNQRETTIVWDIAGLDEEPLYNAIQWCDSRSEIVELASMLMKDKGKSKDDFRERCGLPIHPYFSALKLRWLIDNNKEVKSAKDEGTFAIWYCGLVDHMGENLTGRAHGGKHVTDVTNASRTMLMNIHTLKWDPDLCEFFDIPMKILPKEILSSSEKYGEIAYGSLKGVPICGCLGDQQAALVGQQCFHPLEAKNTYGAGSFLLCNTGEKPVMSNHGMLTTVAYKLGREKAVYALEGAVSDAGEVARWMVEKLGLPTNVEEIGKFRKDVAYTGDMYFVPAFSGLFSEHWNSDARGLIIGLTKNTTKDHLYRATLEAVCFQSREVVDAVKQDIEDTGIAENMSQKPLTTLRVDGGMTENTTLLQMQADVLGNTVVRPDSNYQDMNVLGAAFAAGIAVGVWKDISHLPKCSDISFTGSRNLSKKWDERYKRWQEAMKRGLDWGKSSISKTADSAKSGSGVETKRGEGGEASSSGSWSSQHHAREKRSQHEDTSQPAKRKRTEINYPPVPDQSHGIPLDSMPTLEKLNRLESSSGKVVKIKEQVCSNWECVATHLQFPEGLIDTIKNKNNEPENAFNDMMSRWLRGREGTDVSAISWRTLLQVFQKTDYKVLARELEAILPEVC